MFAKDKSQLFVAGNEGSLYKILRENHTYKWGKCKLKTKKELRQFAFQDENYGLCLGQGNMILETRDGGEKWAQARLAGLQPQCKIHRVFFVQDHLYLQSDQVLYLAKP